MTKRSLWKKLTTGHTREHFVMWAAITGFILSTVNSTFTVYDQVVLKPVADVEQKYQEFEAAVQQITKVAQESTSAALDPNALAAQMIRNAQMQELLENAIRLEPIVKKHVAVADLLVLATVSMSRFNFVAADKFANEAVEIAQGDYLKAEALRLRGRVRGFAGTPESLEKAHTDLNDALKAASTPNLVFERVLALGDWISVDLNAGTCGKVNDLISKFGEAVRDQRIENSARIAYINAMIRGLNDQQRCPWNASLLPISG